MPSQPSSKLRLKPLLRSTVLITDVTTNWHYLDISVGEVAARGPFLGQIAVFSLLLSKTTNFEWKIVFWWGIEMEHLEPTPVDLIAASTLGSNVIHTPFTDTTKMGVAMRYAIAYRSNSAGAVERGIVSAVGGFQFRS